MLESPSFLRSGRRTGKPTFPAPSISFGVSKENAPVRSFSSVSSIENGLCLMLRIRFRLSSFWISFFVSFATKPFFFFSILIALASISNFLNVNAVRLCRSFSVFHLSLKKIFAFILSGDSS